MTLWTMDDEIPRNKPAKGISICLSTPFIWRFPKLGLPPNHPAEVSFPCCWLRGSSVTNLQLCLSRPGRGQGICINKDGPPRDSNLMQHKDIMISGVCFQHLPTSVNHLLFSIIPGNHETEQCFLVFVALPLLDRKMQQAWDPIFHGHPRIMY